MVVLDDLFAKSKAVEVVAVYLDEVGESYVLQAGGNISRSPRIGETTCP